MVQSTDTMAGTGPLHGYSNVTLSGPLTTPRTRPPATTLERFHDSPPATTLERFQARCPAGGRLSRLRLGEPAQAPVRLVVVFSRQTGSNRYGASGFSPTVKPSPLGASVLMRRTARTATLHSVLNRRTGSQFYAGTASNVPAPDHYAATTGNVAAPEPVAHSAVTSPKAFGAS